MWNFTLARGPALAFCDTDCAGLQAFEITVNGMRRTDGLPILAASNMLSVNQPWNVPKTSTTGTRQCQGQITLVGPGASGLESEPLPPLYLRWVVDNNSIVLSIFSVDGVSQAVNSQLSGDALHTIYLPPNRTSMLNGEPFYDFSMATLSAIGIATPGCRPFSFPQETPGNFDQFFDQFFN